MKIRTDFVTNSSSSSYVTVIIKKKDGTEITSLSQMDDIGHGVDPEPLVNLNAEGMVVLLQNVSDGKSLIEAFNRHYQGMYINGSKEFNTEGISNVTDFADVERIEISDNWDGDYGNMSADFTYYPATRQCEKNEDGDDEWDEDFDFE